MAANLRSDPRENGLAHVLDTILKHEYFELILDGIGVETADDILMINPDNLRATTCMLDANQIKLNAMQIGMVKKVQGWYYAQPTKDHTTWFTLTQESFNKFIRQGPPSRNTVVAISPEKKKVSGPKMLDGVKRSVQDYPKFRDDKMWLSWHRSFLAIVATHALTDVLDIHHNPTKDEEADFNAKNIFLYSALVHALHTSKAKAYLRHYEADRNGQLTYYALVHAYADGTAASLNAESLETVLRAMRLDQSWTKSIETFLHTWSTRLHDLESVRDESVSDADKRRWLITSLKGNSTMTQAINTSIAVENNMRSLPSYTKMTWDRFFNILLEQAQVTDAARPPGHGQLKANVQNQQRSGKQKSRKQKKHSDYISPDKWKLLSNAEKARIYEQRKNRAQQNNQSQQSTPPDQTTVVTQVQNPNITPPTTVNTSVVSTPSVAPSEITQNCSCCCTGTQIFSTGRPSPKINCDKWCHLFCTSY